MSAVTIYTKQGCPFCSAAKEHYSDRGIKFEEIDVYSVPGAKKELLRLSSGQSIVPVIVEDGKVQVGYGGG